MISSDLLSADADDADAFRGLRTAAAGVTNGVAYWYIYTLEGSYEVSPRDWVIRGIMGEFYPCKPDIFAATYEPERAAVSSRSADT